MVVMNGLTNPIFRQKGIGPRKNPILMPGKHGQGLLHSASINSNGFVPCLQAQHHGGAQGRNRMPYTVLNLVGNTYLPKQVSFSTHPLLLVFRPTYGRNAVDATPRIAGKKINNHRNEDTQMPWP